MNVTFRMFVLWNVSSELILSSPSTARVPFLMCLYVICSVISQTADVIFSKPGDVFFIVRVAYVIQAPILIILSIALPILYPGWRMHHLAPVIMMKQFATTIQYGVEAKVTRRKILQWAKTAWSGASYFSSWRHWRPLQTVGRHGRGTEMVVSILEVKN
mmetsp:Transcript_41242/g.86129  ORF Transcript_41242/g.86129 Transcript_41242/m.86129 type:complete len:159 (-) Transcript_41242:191-667(-)